MLPSAQAGTGLASHASWNRGRSQSRPTGIRLLGTIEHGHNSAGEFDRPSRRGCAGASHLGHCSAVLTASGPSGVVARLVSFCPSPCLTAGEARAAARTRWQTSGATLSPADSSHGSWQNPSTMDGARGALLAVAKGFRLRGKEVRGGCNVLLRGDGWRSSQKHSDGAWLWEEVVCLVCPMMKSSPKRGHRSLSNYPPCPIGAPLVDSSEEEYNLKH
jgi:hypothetical protein